MYYLKKEVTFSAAHSLAHLDYDSQCRGLHGHNWKATVFCKGATLNKNGMLVDFKDIKENIHKHFDHTNLDQKIQGPSTAECLARFICENTPHCYRVDLQESEGSTASYEEDGE